MPTPRHRLLLTAYGPFPGCPINPTEHLLCALVDRLVGEGGPLDGWQVDRRTLPVTWSAPAQLLDMLKERAEGAYDGILAFGVDGNRRDICVECTGRNERAAKRVDADGQLATAPQIVDGAPDTLEGQLHRSPFNGVAEAARRAGHPVVESRDAGLYLCNEMLYTLLHAVEQADGAFVPEPFVGFFHLPHIDGLSRPEGTPLARSESEILDALAFLVTEYCRRAR